METNIRKQTIEQQNMSIKELEDELGVYFTRTKGNIQDAKEEYYNMVDDELL